MSLYLAKDITQHLADEGFGPETLGYKYDEVEIVEDRGDRFVVRRANRPNAPTFIVYPSELTDQYVWPINR